MTSCLLFDYVCSSCIITELEIYYYYYYYYAIPIEKALTEKRVLKDGCKCTHKGSIFSVGVGTHDII